MSHTLLPRIAVIGGGLAGLAAAAGLVERPVRVELFETRRRLGGRAGSLDDPQTGTLMDRCRHVAMRCCTNLVDFCRRLDLDNAWERYGRLHFFGPDGCRRDLSAAWPPAPLHLAPALARLGYLRCGERLGILRAMARLARTVDTCGPDEPTIGQWLRAAGQSDRAIELFWKPVVLGALAESPDRAALSAARKVFVEGFMASRHAYELMTPTAPLAELFDDRAAAWLAARGATIHRHTRVAQIEGDPRSARVESVVLADGRREAFDFIICAVPWHRAGRLFDAAMLARLPMVAEAAAIPRGAITAVHLWFDRPIVDLPHAVLVGRLSQWVFRHEPHRFEVVLSGSHALELGSREQLAARLCHELAETWPGTSAATLMASRVVTEPAAVFALRPGVEAMRPAAATPVDNLVLAGDWTATGWPATMEGAVRSGRRAAEVVLDRLGQPARLVVADLARGPLARWLFGASAATDSIARADDRRYTPCCCADRVDRRSRGTTS
ncbi:MAG: FAD-dependent oxidoreductase [Pirellulales bacterium]|nr:FAD-dependent oxidoreductase [Pirellulales bacterium]